MVRWLWLCSFWACGKAEHSDGKHMVGEAAHLMALSSKTAREKETRILILLLGNDLNNLTSSIMLHFPNNQLPETSLDGYGPSHYSRNLWGTANV